MRTGDHPSSTHRPVVRPPPYRRAGFVLLGLCVAIAMGSSGCAVQAKQQYEQAVHAASQPIVANQGAGNVAAQAQVDALVESAITGVQYTSTLGLGATLLIAATTLLTLYLSHRREVLRIRTQKPPTGP